MKILLLLLLIMTGSSGFSQAAVELTPGGFATVAFERPARTNEQLLERARGWAIIFNRNNDNPVDVYDVSETGVSIDAFRNNAFFYRNRGEVYYHRIRYTMRIEFGEKTYSINFRVKEIYTDNTLTELTTADFFAPDGRLKEDYEEVKPSLETSANTVINSFASYMAAD
ncbi:MAG TPA: hypothetical protein VF581_10170 [Flavobacterium sp.]|jgi:hypothetical protein